MEMLGRGVYGPPEAGRLAGLSSRRVRAWFYPPSPPGEPRVYRGDYPPVGDDIAISFLDLIDVCLVGRLAASSPRPSLKRIRRVHDHLSQEMGLAHPFCDRSIFLNRGDVFTRPLGNAPGPILKPLTTQAHVDAVLMPFLETIDYDPTTNLARLWHIADGVVVDPGRSFGKPIVDEVGISTSVLASVYKGNNRDEVLVADWWEVHPEHVLAAARFEAQVAAR